MPLNRNLNEMRDPVVQTSGARISQEERTADAKVPGTYTIYSRYSQETSGVSAGKASRDEPGTFRQVSGHIVTSRPWKGIWILF